MSAFLIPHPPATVEQMQAAVIGWREAAAHERFCAENNLCSGWTGTALHNAELYELVAREIEREIETRSTLHSAS
jgi:hypothetical protein